MKVLAGAVLGAFLSLCWSAYSAPAQVEPTDTVVEAMEVAFRAGYEVGVASKQAACELGDLRNAGAP